MPTSALSIECDGREAALNDAPGSAEPGQVATWTAPGEVIPDVPCQVTVIARDGAGNTTQTTADTIVATLVPVSGEGSLTAGVEGRQVGIIARRGPDLGRAAVLVDGEAVGLVDLYAPVAGGPELVHVVDLEPGASASIALEATGTSHPDSAGTAITIDGFVTLAAG